MRTSIEQNRSNWCKCQVWVFVFNQISLLYTPIVLFWESVQVGLHIYRLGNTTYSMVTIMQVLNSSQATHLLGRNTFPGSSGSYQFTANSSTYSLQWHTCSNLELHIHRHVLKMLHFGNPHPTEQQYYFQMNGHKACARSQKMLS